MPIATGNLRDSFHALIHGRYLMHRVPVADGLLRQGAVDGPIDEPGAGWKRRGLWSTNGDRVPRQMEGKGTKPLVVHIQTRPDPPGPTDPQATSSSRPGDRR